MDNSLDAFRVSKNTAVESLKELQLKHDALNARIQKIVDKVSVGDGFNVISAILNITHNKDELDLLGRSLTRVALLVSEFDELKKQMEFLNLFVDTPQVAAMLLGDFSEEIEAGTNLLIQQGQNLDND